MHEWIGKEYRGRSYMLIERAGEVPRIFLFDARDEEFAEQAPEELARVRRIDLAIRQLASDDPEAREEAVLALADEDDASLTHLLVSALADPSPEVREAAEAALEDLEDR